MTDLLHQELAIGDYVVGHQFDPARRSIRILQITEFNGEFVRTDQGSYYPYEVMKINLQYEHAKSLNPEHFI